MRIIFAPTLPCIVLTFYCFLAVLIFFRFVTGLCGAAFLSVSGGTVSDLFISSEIAT